ncbi:substrate-binding domain-containing protein [Fluviibacterium sp. DFM31]|uniref:Substrate-binding domain-containing protein n=1 Tax=Meridianimarinicoccus marinus TaxID=3231483 RepID=A0ABV3LBW2_9RHOB
MGRDFETIPLYSQANVLFAAQDHPLFRKEAIRPEDLLEYPWLALFAVNIALAGIDAYFSRHDLPNPQVAIQSNSIQIALKMLTDHQCIACMPAPLVEAFPDAGLREIDIEGFRWEVPTGLTYRKNMADFATIARICRLLKRETRKHAAR